MSRCLTDLWGADLWGRAVAGVIVGDCPWFQQAISGRSLHCAGRGPLNPRGSGVSKIYSSGWDRAPNFTSRRKAQPLETEAWSGRGGQWRGGHVVGQPFGRQGEDHLSADADHALSVTVPPCNSIIARTSGRPRPVP